MDKARRDEAFAIFKAPHIAHHVAVNLEAMMREPRVRRCPPGMPAHTYLVLGAGWTLPDHIPTTLTTIAVNSALVPLARRGHVPRYILCRESIDMSGQLRRAAELWPHRDTTALLDIGVHPAFAATCRELGIPVMWFIPASLQNFWISELLSEEPVYGGTSNVTAAVAIAEMWGCSRVELLGCSRAYSPDGRAYASGSDWQDIRLTGVEAATHPDGTVDHYVGHIAGLEAKESLHAASGQRPPLRVERMIPLEAVDGSRRWAPETLEDDRRWLAQWAARHPHVVCYQSEPDVAIAGWGHAEASTSPQDARTLLEEAHAQVGRAEAVARAVLDGAAIADVPELLAGSPLPDFAGVGARMRLLRQMQGRGSRTVGPMSRATLEACAELRGWLEAPSR
jgi:hypothetical protein